MSKKERELYDVGSLYESTHYLELVAMDLLKITQESMQVNGSQQEEEGNAGYVLCLVDIYSRQVWAYAIPSKHSELVWDRIQTFLDEVGTPSVILSDNGLEFSGDVELGLVENGIESMKTSIYSPQSNGVCERTHQEILKQLRYLVDGTGKSWTQLLSEAVNTVNRVRAEKSITLSRNSILDEGDLVWVWVEPRSKLSRRWRGPMRIVSVRSAGDSYQVFDYERDTTLTVRRRDVKRCFRTYEDELTVKKEAVERITNSLSNYVMNVKSWDWDSSILDQHNGENVRSSDDGEGKRSEDEQRNSDCTQMNSRVGRDGRGDDRERDDEYQKSLDVRPSNSPDEEKDCEYDGQYNKDDERNHYVEGMDDENDQKSNWDDEQLNSQDEVTFIRYPMKELKSVVEWMISGNERVMAVVPFWPEMNWYRKLMNEDDCELMMLDSKWDIYSVDDLSIGTPNWWSVLVLMRTSSLKRGDIVEDGGCEVVQEVDDEVVQDVGGEVDEEIRELEYSSMMVKQSSQQDALDVQDRSCQPSRQYESDWPHYSHSGTKVDMDRLSIIPESKAPVEEFEPYDEGKSVVEPASPPSALVDQRVPRNPRKRRLLGTTQSHPSSYSPGSSSRRRSSRRRKVVGQWWKAT